MKNIIPKKSLYLKFNLIIVGSIFLCGIMTILMFFYTLKSSMGNDLEHRANETALSLGNILSNDILLDNKYGVYEQLVNTMKYNDQIRYIIVTSPNNDIISSTFPDGFPVGLDEYRQPKENIGTEIDSIRFNSNEGPIREIMTMYNNGIIGSIRVGISENHMDMVIKKRIFQISVSVLCICLIASILASIGANRILSPLRKISKALTNFGRGKKQEELKISTGDEIENLARAFNDMTQNLSRKQKENDYLVDALKKKEEKRIYLLSQLFNAREDERRHLSQELHDQTSQSMVSIMAYLRILYNRLQNEDNKRFALDIRDLTSNTLDSIRSLALTLHPPLLSDLGLIKAIEKYIDMVHQTYPSLKIRLEYAGDFNNIPDMLNLTCYRLIQEGITNIQKHANASFANILLINTDSEIKINIIDNGIGFDRETMNNAKKSHHLGLISMEERVNLLQGEFLIHSHLGEGAHIEITLPLDFQQN